MIDWVNVKDRMPPERRVVIVSGGVGYWNGERWMTITGFRWPGETIKWEVTHWAELEEQPSELNNHSDV